MGFRRLSERDVHAWASFRLVTGSFEGPGGERFERTYLHHPGAVAVVPVDGVSVVLVRQYRPALGRELLEIPAGTLDKGAEESPAACAGRELMEEVGAVAGSLTHLATYAVAPGVSSEHLHLYVARDLTLGETSADGIEEEAMTVERLAVADVDAAIADGRVEDAKTIVGLLLARDRGLLD